MRRPAIIATATVLSASMAFGAYALSADNAPDGPTPPATEQPGDTEAPGDPLPPAPVDPAPVDPAPVDPAPVDPDRSAPVDPEPAAPADDCSAADLAVTQALAEGVPTVVAEKMAAIIAAAQACDFDRLAGLIATEGFTATFGQTPEDIASFWRDREAAGEPVTEIMVKLLLQPSFATTSVRADGSEGTLHVMPRLMSEDVSAADRQRMDDAFGADVVAGWMADGMYLGYRIGITADGDWTFFVVGD